MKTRTLIYVSLMLVLLFAAFFLVENQAQTIEREPSSLNLDLDEPLFVTRARAESTWINEYLDTEAGLSAWVQGAPIDLNVVAPLLNVEYITSDYVIGGLKQALPGYSEAESPHIYTDINGWIMVYYKNDSVASRIVDIVYFKSSRTIRTKLQVGIDLVTTALGWDPLSAKYYDFRYPNATNMMTIAETDQDGDNYFYVEVPSSHVIHEYSYTVYGDGDGLVDIVIMWINNVEFKRCFPYCYGTVSSTLLPFDTSNKISYNDEGSVTILYGEQP